MAETKTLNYTASEIDDLLAAVKSSATIKRSVIDTIEGDSDALVTATAILKLHNKARIYVIESLDMDTIIDDLTYQSKFVALPDAQMGGALSEAIKSGCMICVKANYDNGGLIPVSVQETNTNIFLQLIYRGVLWTLKIDKTYVEVSYVRIANVEELYIIDDFTLTDIVRAADDDGRIDFLFGGVYTKLSQAISKEMPIFIKSYDNENENGGVINIDAVDDGVSVWFSIFNRGTQYDVTIGDDYGIVAKVQYAELEDLNTIKTELLNNISQTNQDLLKLGLRADATYAKKNDIASQLPEEWYGIMRDQSLPDPTWTRIGSSVLHETLPIQNKMRGCILDVDGNVVKYLPATNWSVEDTNGSLGQVMVEIPEFYIKFEYDEHNICCKMSLLPLEGFERVPKFYISAYEAAVFAGSSLPYLVSRSGQKCAYTTLLQLRNLARSISGSGYKWNTYTYDAHKILVWLYLVEYATNQSQASIRYKNPLSFQTGGLGTGCTNVPSDLPAKVWRNGVGTTGSSDVLGNSSGEVAVSFTYADVTYNTKINRYRGIENPFGSVDKLVDGLYIVENNAYIQHSPLLFGDSENMEYNEVVPIARTKGYISFIAGTNGNIIATDAQATSTTGYCDTITNLTGTTPSNYGRATVGGACVDGEDAGMFRLMVGSWSGITGTTRIVYVTEL